MDDPLLNVTEHQRALTGLSRINLLTLSTRVLWNAIKKKRSSADRPLSVLDVACGGGDVLIDIGRRASKCRLPIQLTGLDISPIAIQQTQASAQRAKLEIETLKFDVLGDEPLPVHDVVFSSLFLHHLNSPDATLVLKKMAAATRQQLLVSDLVRSRKGHLLAWFGTRLLTTSKIVHTDGPLSVEAAYTPAELRAICQQAQLETAQVQTFFPERMLLSWSPITLENS